MHLTVIDHVSNPALTKQKSNQIANSLP